MLKSCCFFGHMLLCIFLFVSHTDIYTSTRSHFYRVAFVAKGFFTEGLSSVISLISNFGFSPSWVPQCSLPLASATISSSRAQGACSLPSSTVEVLAVGSVQEHTVP